MYPTHAPTYAPTLAPTHAPKVKIEKLLDVSFSNKILLLL